MKGDIYGNWKTSEEGKRQQRKIDYVQGVWESLPGSPYIKDKYHLKEVCQREGEKFGRTFIPKIFMKPKSQGKGVEWTF